MKPIYFANGILTSGGVNNRDTQRTMLESQKAGYSRGIALKRHTESAHNGVVNEECPACRDIQERMKLL